MDELIQQLENGNYAGFLLDGQVIPALDYLELKPEMKNRLKQLVAEGKLQLGPWYTLPDEYPVDGEALVRNLLFGGIYAESLGGNFKVGYTSFGWGQSAQLVQIYAGFGIHVVMVGKRVGNQRAPSSEFIWQSPDGSKMLATRFGVDGRANFYVNSHLSLLFGFDHKGKDWKYNWTHGGIAFHRADSEQVEQDFFRLDAPGVWYPEWLTQEYIDAQWKTTDDSVLNNDRLMMNGSDYSAAQPYLKEMINKINDLDSDPARRWIQATMPEYIKIMEDKIDQSKLRVIQGELRDGPAGPLTGNALSTRLYLKQLNKKAQNMLIRNAEPFAAMASMAGADFPAKFIEKAWMYLLESHPHDSINGVTQDKTANDVQNRLEQVIDISRTVSNRALQVIVSNINMDKYKDDDVLITLFNPLPYERSEIVEAWVAMPDNRPADEIWKAYAAPVGLQVFDGYDNPVDTQNQGYSVEKYSVSELHTRAFPFHCLRHKIYFLADKIPASGYAVFKVKNIDENTMRSSRWSDSAATTGTLLRAPSRLENEYLVIEMNPNGTFNITHKKSLKVLHNLNYYEDRGELGDYWFNERPMYDQAHTSLGCAARIWAEESGPLHASLVSEITMHIPKKSDFQKKARSTETLDLTIKTRVTLRAGVKYAEVQVEFENRHEDHYLRAIFPTALTNASHVDVGGHFIVDHRPIRPQGPTETSYWPDMGTQPMNNFIDVSDGMLGLGFLSDSLTEYEVIDNEERTVALSLLRSVKNWICTEMRVGSNFPSQNGGQSLGIHKLRYALMPHEGDWSSVNVPLMAELFNIMVTPVQTRRHQGTLSADKQSFYSVDNQNIIFSAIKKNESNNNIIIRFYNPSPGEQKALLHISAGLDEAWLTSLDESRLEKVDVSSDNSILLFFSPHKIVSVELKMASIEKKERTDA
jgi:mannosylglycerate hydrolase